MPQGVRHELKAQARLVHSFPERAGQEQRGSSSFIHHAASTGARP